MNFWVDSNYGNGDGYINWFDEGYYAWQHLAKAEIINANFTGSARTAIMMQLPIPMYLQLN